MYTMKHITKISAQKRPGRYNIFLDEKYAFSVSAKVLADFVLVKDKEVTDEQISAIQKADNNARAEEKALHFLGYQPRSKKELKTYLKGQEIDPETIEQVCENLAELGYLDDVEYAKLFTRNNMQVGHEGPRSVVGKLIQKGIDKETAEQVVAEGEPDLWVELATKLAQPMQKKAGRLSQKEIKTKIKQKLFQHGFNSIQIDEVLEELQFEDDDAQLEALKIQGVKAYKKAKKYTGYERERKLKQLLFQKGFSSAEIQSFLDGEVIPLAELDEY